MFKEYKLNWKQISIFKLALLSIGMIIGAYLADFIKDYVAVFLVVAIISSAYTIVIALKQTK